MSRIARVIVPGCAHHVTQRGVRSMTVFRGDADRHIYLQLMVQQARLHELRFLAWCLMDNHVHFVVVPPGPGVLAQAIGEAHRRYTWLVNRRDDVRGWLFQGRFFSCPLDEPHGLAAIRYVERNPVRAGLAAQPWEYPWSSAAFHAGKRKNDPLVTHSDLMGSPEEWRQWLKVDPPEAASLRSCIRNGRPCGAPRFIARAEKATGRDLRLGKRGRPWPTRKTTKRSENK